MATYNLSAIQPIPNSIRIPDACQESDLRLQLSLIVAVDGVMG